MIVMSTMDDYRQEWIEEAADLLGRIKGRAAQKKRETIIALVDARINNRHDATAFEKAGTGHQITYHRLWKHDPVFRDVLAEVERLASHWHNLQQARQLAVTAEKLAQLAPTAADVLAEAMRSPDMTIALKAALAVLDRAGVATAVKQRHEHVGPAELPIGALMTLEEWRSYQNEQRKNADSILEAFDARPVGETEISS